MASPDYFAYINSKVWKDKSALFRNKTAGRCSIFPWLKATDAHHLTYDNFKNEGYIKDCIPVSRFVHNLIHKNSIGLYFWADIRGRRRWMNFVFRLMAIVTTIGAAFIFPAYKLYRIYCPKFRAKPRLRKRIKNVG